jgi:hypothetical protein
MVWGFCYLRIFKKLRSISGRSLHSSGGLSGEATEAGPHPHLSMNLNKNLFLIISILQICFYIIIIV